MVELKSPDAIERMRAAGQVVGRTLAAVTAAAVPGARLRDLDTLAAAVIRDHGATPAFLHYHPGFAPTPFPGVICTSVNDVIVHGIPGDYRLRDGDLLSVDAGAHLHGWTGDAATTVHIGTPRPADRTLLDTAQRALRAGIDAARVGHRLGDISAAIAAVIRAAGYGNLAGFGGHGIGRAMHEDPHVPNTGRPGHGPRLHAGLVLALEPMLLAGGRDTHVTDPDGWSLRTTDGSRAAHVEHTVAITADGPRILTLP